MFFAYIRNSGYRMHRYYCSRKMEVILAVIIAAAAITAYFPQVASAVDVHPYSRGVKKHR